MSKIIMAAVYFGGVLVLAGILGGASGTLSDYLPLVLAAAGTGLLYLVLMAIGIVELWRMDE